MTADEDYTRVTVERVEGVALLADNLHAALCGLRMTESAAQAAELLGFCNDVLALVRWRDDLTPVLRHALELVTREEPR